MEITLLRVYIIFKMLNSFHSQMKKWIDRFKGITTNISGGVVNSSNSKATKTDVYGKIAIKNF